MKNDGNACVAYRDQCQIKTIYMIYDPLGWVNNYGFDSQLLFANILHIRLGRTLKQSDSIPANRPFLHVQAYSGPNKGVKHRDMPTLRNTFITG